MKKLFLGILMFLVLVTSVFAVLTFTVPTGADKAKENVGYDYNLTVSGASATGNLIFTKDSGTSSWISMDANGKIYGTPSEDDSGVNTVNFSVVDNKGTSNTGDDETGTFSYTINVEPGFCEVGDEENLKINKIDFDDEDYKPFDSVSISVDVEAKDDVEDVQVKAILYNVDSGKEIDNIKSDKTDLNQDDEETFDLEFEIPNDEDVGVKDEYLLYVVVTGQDDNGDDQCVQDSEDINIERDDHDVVISQVSAVPSIVSCGDTVSVTADVNNIGTKDEDGVYVKVIDSELKWDEQSASYNLDKYSKSDNDAVVRFELKVPENAKEKTYNVNTRVYFDDGSETKETYFNLVVEKCTEEVVPNVPSPEGRVFTLSFPTGVNQLSTSMKVSDKALVTLTDKQHTIGVQSITENSALLSIDGSATTTLGVGESKNIDFDVNGINDLSVSLVGVNQDTGVFSFTKLGVAQPPSTGNEFVPITSNSVFDKFGSSTTLFIVGDILLVILLIVLLAFLFRRPRRPRPH